MAYDDILGVIGEFGTYHRVAFVLLALVNAYVAFSMFLAVFCLVDVPFRCSVPGLPNDTFHIQDESHQRLVNASIPYDVTTGLYSQCSAYLRDSAGDTDNSTVVCESWVFDPDYAANSMVATLSLVCDREHIKAQFPTMLALGCTLSAVIAGPAADTFGRKRPMIIFVLIQSVAIFLMPFTPNVHALVFLVLVICTFIFASYLNSLTLILEIIGPGKRGLGAGAVLLGWCGGLFAIVPFFYFISDWRTECYVVAVMGFSFIIYWWILDESPRWLLAQGRVEDAKKIFRRMAKVNKVKLPAEVDDVMKKMNSGTETVHVEKKFRLMDIKPMFTSKVLCFRFFIISFCWFSILVIYSGSTYSIGSLIEGDLYLNFLLQAIMETLGYGSGSLFMKYFGRKPLIGTFMLVAGVSYLVNGLSILLDIATSWIPLISYGFGKFGITGGYIVLCVAANELMPTVFRNSAVGVCIFIGQMGGIAAPYLVIMDSLFPTAFGRVMPLFVFSILSIASALLTFFLPETKNRKLPDTIQDTMDLSINRTTEQLQFVVNEP